MIPRFICPHCHHSIDPLTLETADGAHAQYRICPECDEPIVLTAEREDTGESCPTVLPTVAAFTTSVAESVVP